jgi:hypothetical protein
VTFKRITDKKKVINVFDVKYFNLSQVEVLRIANQQLVEVESIKEQHTSSGLKIGRWQVIANKRISSWEMSGIKFDLVSTEELLKRKLEEQVMKIGISKNGRK